MTKVFDIKKTSVSSDCRLDPTYYYFNEIIKQRSLANGVVYDVLKNMCDVISDGEHSAIPRQKEKGVRYLYGRNIKDGIVNFDPNTDSSYISEDNYKSFTRIHLKEDDILLTIVGTIGKTALYKQDYIGKAGIPRHIAKIRLKKDCGVSPEYIVAFFLSKLGKWQLNNITTGNIQPLLSIGNIEKLGIPIINKILHDDITEKEKRCIKCETLSLDLISQAQQLFYRQMGVDLRAVKKVNTFSVNRSDLTNSNLWTPMFSYPQYVDTMKSIKEKWKTVSIGRIADLQKGDEVGSDAYNGYLTKRKTDVPFVRTSDIVNYEIDQFPDFYIPVEVYHELGQDIKPGDVLFTNDGKIGQVSIVTVFDKFILQSHIKRIRLNHNATQLGITPEYLFLALTIKEIGIYQCKRFTVIQSTIPTMANNLNYVEIPVLDRNTILEITSLVNQAFQLKDEKKRLIKEFRETLDEYFEI